MDEALLRHIKQVAACPSFSSYEERLHPYIYRVFKKIPAHEELEVTGNNLVFRLGNRPDLPTIAFAAHLDKINHFGEDVPDILPVAATQEYVEGAMDNSVGVGLLLHLAELAQTNDWPNLLFFFSEMEESKGLREHPELLKDGGKEYVHGMGARRIARRCMEQSWLPEEVITLDTTPLFKGEPGIALYSKHWELNELHASRTLKESTGRVVERLQAIAPAIRLHNNTNDYLHYGYEFNTRASTEVVSVALEPAVYPYHQLGERVAIGDIERVLKIAKAYLETRISGVTG